MLSLSNEEVRLLRALLRTVDDLDDQANDIWEDAVEKYLDRDRPAVSFDPDELFTTAHDALAEVARKIHEYKE